MFGRLLQVDLALQILQIAEKFTDNQLGYGLYWTDLDYHNLAVNDKGRVSVIDGENIIVVDTWQIKKGMSSLINSIPSSSVAAGGQH